MGGWARRAADLVYAAGVLALGIFWIGAGGALAQTRPGSADAPRVDAIFVIDNSGSMRSSDPEFVTRRIVPGFARALDRGSRIGVVLFDAEARLLEPLTRAVGPDAESRWETVMEQVDYRGQLTNSSAGIERALYELKQHGRDDVERLIVFLTDGIVDTGDRDRDAEKKRWLTETLAEESRRLGVRIFGIALTEAADVELIQALALHTEGEYFRVVDPNDIDGAVGRIGQAVSIDAAERRRADLAPTPAAPPPVASAPSTRTRGAVLLALGVLVAFVALLAPAIQRRRRLRAPRVPPPSMERVEVPLAPRSPRSTDRQPIAHLVDVSKVSARGLLPIPIDKRRISVGRDENNDVSIRRDTISSFHATIDYKDGYFWVEDHRSTNGTSVNGKHLEPNVPMQLKSGDQVQFSVFEFRFVIPDREPRGRTLVLDGTSLPEPASARPDAAAGGDPHAEARAITRYPDAFAECLRVHLDKIEALGTAHSDFVESAFPEAFVEVLHARATELIGTCEQTGTGQTVDLTRSGVHYTLCVLPEPMDGAAAWFGREYGGYAQFLSGLLERWASGQRECRAICVVTFGMVAGAWISITILPARPASGGEEIEIMSFEFLSEEERSRALSLDIVDVERPR